MWLSMTFPTFLKAAEATWADKTADPELKVLTEEEAAELGAICDQIYPADDTPGAVEIGVVAFIDGALASFMAGVLPGLRGGLADVKEKTAALYPGKSLISALDDEGQLAVMNEIAAEPYFNLIRYMTIAGLFSHPSYGGNRNRMGWRHLGFDDRHAWQPPFGYYDANYEQED